MHAYKAFNINENGQLQCRDFIYEEGQTYEMSENIGLCKRGFHACLDWYDCQYYYNLIDSNVTLHHVELLGKIIKDPSKVVTNKIKIGKAFTPEDLGYLENDPYLGKCLFIKYIASKNRTDPAITSFINDKDWHVRAAVAAYGTDEMRLQLIHDRDWHVRAAVAENGTDEMRLQLIHDEDWCVRRTVVERGNDETHLQLLNDANELVRATIAQYGNDEMRLRLIHDNDWHVRAAVAKYGTDEMRLRLIYDRDWYVRAAVAEYGTDKMRLQLLNDESAYVHNLAFNLLKKKSAPKTSYNNK